MRDTYLVIKPKDPCSLIKPDKGMLAFSVKLWRQQQEHFMYERF
jgi:hypothetical protein